MRYSSAPCIVRMSTRVDGTAARISTVASRPFGSPIDTSITQTSGRARVASATASRPLEASLTT